MSRLHGRVVRVTVQKLKSGRVRHDTRVEFDGDSAFRSVRVQGTCENMSGAWDAELLEALRSRYDLPDGLPEPRWVKMPRRETVDGKQG